MMASESEPENVSLAAAHILILLDNVQEQLATIRRTAEKIVKQQKASDVRQQEGGDASQP